MKTFSIYGASDDLVETAGVPGCDEFNIISDDVLVGTFVLGGKMRIRALYDGCWSFSVGQVDEEIPLPDWPIRIKQHERGYSTEMEIDVPDDVTLIREKK